MRSSVHPLRFWFVAVCSAGVVPPLSAQDSGSAVVAQAPPEQSDSAALRTAERSAASGVFLRLAESATTSTHRVAVSTHGGYDGARQGVLFESRGEVVLLARSGLPRRSPIGLSLVGGGSFAAGSAGSLDLSTGRVGIKLQPVFEQAAGFDAALSVAYESRGFNLVPAVAADLLLARRIGETQWVLNIGYGAGLTEAERAGKLRTAMLTPVVGQLSLGLEARGALDLERDDDEPSGEPDYEVTAGAVANYTISHISLTAGAGPTALRYRNGKDAQLGVVATIGVGASL